MLPWMNCGNRHWPLLMIINDLYVYRAWCSVRPFKTNPPLVIDANAVLTLSLTCERLKPIARQHEKVLERGSDFQPVELQAGRAFDSGEGFDTFPRQRSLWRVCPD